jgi:tetratricopeptide (TPR) repeat protein
MRSSICAKAGNDAARKFVNQVALDYLGRALALTPQDDAATRFSLLETRRGVYSNTGRRGEQAGDIAALERVAEELGDDARSSPAPPACAQRSRSSSAIILAWLRLRRVPSLGPEGAGEGARRAVGAHQLGACAAVRGQLRGRAGADRGVARPSRARSATARSRHCARPAWHPGDAAGPLRHRGATTTARRWAVARAIGNRVVESGMINNLGEVEQLLGNYDAALEQFEAGRRLCAQIGQRLADGYLLCNMASSAFRRGDTAGSMAWETQAMQLAEELKDRDLQAHLHCVRGHAHAARSEWDDASACYQAALALFRELGRATMPPEPIAGLARVALARGDVAGAMATIAEVVAHLDGGGSVDGTEDPLWIYFTCHEVLAAAARPRAAEFLEHAHRILSERAEPLGAAERATFLGNVPTNRAIVAAWKRCRGVS